MNSNMIDDDMKDELIEKLITHPEDFDAKEIEKILSDEDMRQRYQDACLIRAALMRQQVDSQQVGRSLIDDSQQVDELEETGEHTARPYRMWTWIGAAAAACVALLITSQFLPSSRSQLVVPEGAHVAYESKVDAPRSFVVEQDGEEYAPEQLKDAKGVSYQNRTIVLAQLSPEDQEPTSIINYSGKAIRVRLADGTQVWLNAQSTLAMDEQYNGKERKVKLVGEAYFEVKHMEDKPFTVSMSNHTEAKVLGTVFNAKSYPNEKISVTLVSGRVKVASPKGSTILHPNQTAEADDMGNITVEKQDAQSSATWRNGQITMDNKPLQEAMAEIGRAYHQNVVFLSQQHANDKIHFDVETTVPLTDIIQMVNEISGANMSVKDQTIYIP